MKKVLFTFLALTALLTLNLSAQINDVNLPTGPGNAVKITQVANNKFVVIGHGYGQAYALKLNRYGQPIQIIRFGNILGGSSSFITDMVYANGSYYMTGFCDKCVPGSPARKLVVVKTDENFRVQAVRKMIPPANQLNEQFMGWNKMEADGSNLVVMSQLIYRDTTSNNGNAQDTLTNFALTRFNQDLDTSYHKRYDYGKYDNVGDLMVNGGKYLAMAWDPNYTLNQPLFGFGNERTYVHAINPVDGAIEATWPYRGIGLVLSKVAGSANIAIGGAVSETTQTGPQASVRVVEPINGVVLDSVSFGIDGRADAIVELQSVSGGGFLAIGAMNMSYPSSAILLSSIYDFNRIVNPRDARIYRINSNLLVSAPRIIPNDRNVNVLHYSIVPQSTDGINFVSVGYKGKSAHFYGYNPTSFAKDANNDEVSAMNQAAERNELNVAVEASLFPNPATAQEGAFLNLTGDVQASVVRIFDMKGALVQETVINAAGRYRIGENLTPGAYTVTLVGDKAENFRLVIR